MNFSGIPIIVTCLVLLFFSVAFWNDRVVAKCNERGGVHVNSQCFKAEIINLRNK